MDRKKAWTKVREMHRDASLVYRKSCAEFTRSLIEKRRIAWETLHVACNARLQVERLRVTLENGPNSALTPVHDSELPEWLESLADPFYMADSAEVFALDTLARFALGVVDVTYLKAIGCRVTVEAIVKTLQGKPEIEELEAIVAKDDAERKAKWGG